MVLRFWCSTVEPWNLPSDLTSKEPGTQHSVHDAVQGRLRADSGFCVRGIEGLRAVERTEPRHVLRVDRGRRHQVHVGAARQSRHRGQSETEGRDDPPDVRRPRRVSPVCAAGARHPGRDRKSTRLNSSHVEISYAVFCLKKKKKKKK